MIDNSEYEKDPRLFWLVTHYSPEFIPDKVWVALDNNGLIGYNSYLDTLIGLVPKDADVRYFFVNYKVEVPESEAH